MLMTAIAVIALAMAQQADPSGSPSCQWEGEVAPASTADGHRLRVVFVDTAGHVALSLGEARVFDRVLREAQDGTGYSGAVQCRLLGQQRLTISAFGQQTVVWLHMDEPNLVVIHGAPGRLWIDVEQTDQPPMLD